MVIFPPFELTVVLLKTELFTMILTLAVADYIMRRGCKYFSLTLPLPLVFYQGST